MTRRKQFGVGLGLLAAATVFLLAFFMREATNEPAGAALVFAAIFGVLGLKALWRSRNGKSSESEARDR